MTKGAFDQAAADIERIALAGLCAAVALQESLPQSDDYAEHLRYQLAERVEAWPPSQWSTGLLYAVLRLLEVLAPESRIERGGPTLRLVR